MHTHAEVTRDQFEIRADLVIHTPTGAEFIPHSGNEDSVMVWTGNVGRRLSSGLVYQYSEVLAMMKAVWRERSSHIPGGPQELLSSLSS
jgi:hypothetical protein